MSGWIEYRRMPQNTTHIAYVQENGEVYLPEFGWERAGASALLEDATPLIRIDEVAGRTMRKPTEADYDAVITMCRRDPEYPGRPSASWCTEHDSLYYQADDKCERRQDTEHAIDLMLERLKRDSEEQR